MSAREEMQARYCGSDRAAQLVGEHPKVVAARETFRAIAAMPRGTRPPPLLLSGEPETEKMLVAGLFQYFTGPRHGRGMADSDWLAMSEADAEWQLFGNGRWPGYFDALSRGSVLIQNVERASPHLQERLMVAATDPGKAWVICSSEVDLVREVQAGRFDNALRETLCTQWIDLPPLRARGRDVILIAEYILAWWCVHHDGEPGDVRLAPDAVDALLAYSWPRNFAELEDAVKDAAVAVGAGEIRATDLFLGR